MNSYWWRISSTQEERKYELVLCTKACWLWRFNISAHLWVKSSVRATCLLFLKLSSFVACYFVRMCDSVPETKKASLSLTPRSVRAWYAPATQQCGCWSLRVGVDVAGFGLYRHTDWPDWHVSLFSSYSPEISCKIPVFCHDCFVPNPFQFRIHQSLFHGICITASLNEPHNKQ
jgi:hypothetical protein